MVICAQRYKRWRFLFPLHLAFLLCECTGLLGLAPLLLVPACTQLQFREAHASTTFSADLRCRQCKKLCRKQCRRLCMMV